MKKNLISTLVVSSLFMPSIEAIQRRSDLNSLENENNIYEAVDILISSGPMTMEEKRKKKERQKKAQEIRKRQKVINEKGYFPYWAKIRKKVLIEKTKISNEPIGKGDLKVKEAGEDLILKAKIESSFDQLLMGSLKARQSGNVSYEAVSASKKEKQINQFTNNNFPLLSKIKNLNNNSNNSSQYSLPKNNYPLI